MTTTTNGFPQTEDSEYVRLVSLISGIWDKAREKAALSVNTELLDASWRLVDTSWNTNNMEM